MTGAGTQPAPAVTPTLDHVRVRDAMHPGTFSCSAAAPLRDVVAIMAHYRVHALVVLDTDGHGAIGVVSDRDVLAAVCGGDMNQTAGDAAATAPVTISGDERLDRAARLMAEHDVAHLVVLDHAHGHPTGMLSTLDIAAVIAREPGEMSAEPSRREDADGEPRVCRGTVAGGWLGDPVGRAPRSRLAPRHRGRGRAARRGLPTRAGTGVSCR